MAALSHSVLSNLNVLNTEHDSFPLDGKTFEYIKYLKRPTWGYIVWAAAGSQWVFREAGACRLARARALAAPLHEGWLYKKFPFLFVWF